MNSTCYMTGKAEVTSQGQAESFLKGGPGRLISGFALRGGPPRTFPRSKDLIDLLAAGSRFLTGCHGCSDSIMERQIYVSGKENVKDA